MRFTCLSVPTCTLLSCYIFSNEFMFFVMYMNLYIYTVSLSNSIICWHHCTRRFMCISSCTDFCWYMLTLGNYILLVFCFSFLCEWLNVSCPSIEWNLFIRIVRLYAFYTVYVCYTSLWSCSRTRIMNKFVHTWHQTTFFFLSKFSLNFSSEHNNDKFF